MIILLVLLGLGSLDRWIRAKSWLEERTPAPALGLVGAALGLAALGAAVLAATPLLERVTTRSIEWTQLAMVRGNLGILATAAMIAALAIASELVFRRWILERVLGFGAHPLVAVAVAAIAEGAATRGDLLSRAGAALAGIGFGLLYIGAGRRLAPATACRVAFEVGALTLVGMRVL